MSQAENETARPILVFRVVFDDFSAVYGLSKLGDTYLAQEHTIDGMARELELALVDLAANIFDHCHDASLSHDDPSGKALIHHASWVAEDVSFMDRRICSKLNIRICILP